MKDLDGAFDEFLQNYDRSLNGLRQCLSGYEARCRELIEKIAKSSSITECGPLFDELYAIQGRLAKLLFVREVGLGDRLDSLTREFDRLHDPYIREYWAKRFKDGVDWPLNSNA